MSIQEREQWITGEEFGEEWLRLVKAGSKHDSPELKALLDRVGERDDEIWAMYAGPLIEKYPGQWAAISPTGEWVIRPVPGQVVAEGTRRFGAGGFAFGKLAEFRGFQM
jgi:hypothetical protein